jgi:hypothetical protein
MRLVGFLALIIVFLSPAFSHSDNRTYCCECPGKPSERFEVRTGTKLRAVRECKEACGFDYDDPNSVPPKITWGRCGSTKERNGWDGKEADGP